MNNEFNPGQSPLEMAKNDPSANLEDAQWRTIIGLEEAMVATEKSIAEHDNDVLHEHLASLRSQLITNIKQSLDITNEKIKEVQSKGGDSGSLEEHRANLNNKLDATMGRPVPTRKKEDKTDYPIAA